MRILLVEDEYEIRSIVELVLNFEKHEVKSCSNGLEAYQWITSKEGGPSVDLVLTDAMMPLMDGFELIDKIRSIDHLKRIPILMMSAAMISEERAKQRDISFLRKPFNLDVLKKSVNEVSAEK